MGCLQRFAERRAADAFADVDRAAVGMHVGQRGGEVGVDGRGGRVQLHFDRAGDFGVFGQRLRGVDQHVVPRLDGLAILRAPDLGVGRNLPAQRVHRIGRIVDEACRAGSRRPAPSSSAARRRAPSWHGRRCADRTW